MARELSSESCICYRCGMKYNRRRGFFPVSYAAMHKGIGHMPVCRSCVDEVYGVYLHQCEDSKLAIRQICRKLDLYWNEEIYDSAISRAGNRSVISRYLMNLSANKYAGKCYDDTLSEEGMLWAFENLPPVAAENRAMPAASVEEGDGEESAAEEFLKSYEVDVTEDIMAFWGYGYPASMYSDLEQRWTYWMARMQESGHDPESLDIGTEAVIKQICCLEVDIKHDRIAGKAVDKSINTLNSLLGSANLKPAQKKDGLDAVTENTPLGVWIRRWETQRPVPEPDPELQDVDGIVKYILVWVYGHLAKMLNIKNAHSVLYENEVARLRVERPEYDEEDDETMFSDIFGGASDGEE